MNHTILILEDEDLLRDSMVRGLSKLPDLTVLSAGTFAEAVNEIDANEPDLIISDLDLPDGSGLELIGVLGGRRTPIIFVSAYLQAYGRQIPPNANVKVHEKPVSIEDLRGIVRAELSLEERSPFSVTDFLQLAVMSRRSVEVVVKHHGQTDARIVVRDGEPWAASDGRGSGLDAFYRLAMVDTGEITCGAVRGDDERTVEGSLEHLLLEAARRMDEGGEPELAPTNNPEPSFEDLMRHANEAILDRDYDLAMTHLTRARELQPMNVKVERMVGKISKLRA